MKLQLLSLALLSLTSISFAQKKKDFATMPSQAKEAKEMGNLKLADSLAQDYINNYLFKLKECELFSKENLRFIGEFLDVEKSKGFRLFLKEPEKVNQVLGDYMAQWYLMTFINNKYLPSGDYKQIGKPNWDALEKVVIAKFGALGQEITYGQRMIFYLVNEDWKNYGIWYQRYFEKGLKHPRYHVNNMSWNLFEHVDDPIVLSFACFVMKYAIDELPYKDQQALDTYANLLYKTGKKDEAIAWEEKAVKLSNNNKELVETLEKMKSNIATWSETTKN